MTLQSLDVFGTYRGPTGYDHHVRQFVRQLSRQGIAVHLHNTGVQGHEPLSPPGLDPWFASLNRPVGARTAVHFTFPNQVVAQAGMLNVNHTMFEAIPAHSSWVELNRLHDLVLLPSESSRIAWIAGGMPPEKIRLCPLGIDPELYRQPAMPLPLRRDNGVPVAEYRVRFLNISAAGPRKNLNGLLRTWIRATNRGDDAILILKLGFYWQGAYEDFRLELDAMQEEIGKTLQDAAPVHFIQSLLPEEDMPRLYRAASHYISMSHGEGWDLPMMEAAASDLRLIAPNHSAYTAYLDSDIAQLISSREVPTRFRGSAYFTMLFQGAMWWDPDEDEAAAFIRAAIDGRETGKDSPRERILSRFSWEQATRRLIEILSDLEDRALPRASV